MVRPRTLLLVGLLAGSLVALAHRSDLQEALRGVGRGVRARIGQPAPELPRRLGALGGPPVRLADLRGRVVLLHFWTYG
jgi:hypothetical protein